MFTLYSYIQIVTLVVTFGFMLQSFKSWQGPTNDGFTQKWKQLLCLGQS